MRVRMGLFGDLGSGRDVPHVCDRLCLGRVSAPQHRVEASKPPLRRHPHVTRGAGRHHAVRVLGRLADR